MRYLYLFLTLAVLCVPRWVNANDNNPKSMARSTTSLKQVKLKALMVPQVSFEQVKNQLAAPPPKFENEDKPLPRVRNDVEFFRRAQTRYVYGE